MKTIKIAFRNLNRQKRRSVLLGIAVAFVFLISTFILGMANGLLQNMEYNIASSVGGDIWICAATKKPDVPADKIVGYDVMYQEQETLFDDIVKECKVNAEVISRRSPIDGQLIFAGKKLSNTIWGIKEDEKLAWDSIVYKEGNRAAMKKENAILLSETIAENLNLHLHDTILFETKTDQGQSTIAEFQLEGIAVDTNLLSSAFTVFANIDYIHKIYGITGDNAFGSYFILLKNSKQQEEVANAIEAALRNRNILVTDRALAKEKVPTMPLQHLNHQLGSGNWNGYKYMVASMIDIAPQMIQVKFTVQTIAFVVLIVLLALTMIGVVNTFRMIVFERRGEIGTMRACGARAKSVKWIFLMEGFLLTLIGALAGLLLGILIMSVLSLIPIARDSMLSAFAHAGHLAWQLDPLAVIAWFSILAILTLLAVAGPAGKASKMLPAEALRTKQ